MHAHYSGTRLLLLYIALGLGTFIQILDSSIANVAVPYIAGNLSVSADQGTWVITSFSASNAVVLPLTGWLSDYFGRVKLFVVSVLLFSLTSFLCGFSTSLEMLVFFRVLQGAVAGSLIPLSQSLILINTEPEKQGSALGFWVMIVIVAPVIGPILGGYITEEYSWPWIFYINVPIGLFSAAITWIMLKDYESEIQRKPIDWVGLFLLTMAVASIQIMLDNGQDLDWFRSNTIVALTVVSIISLAYFIVWNAKTLYPIVDFSFFQDRNFVVGTIVVTVGYLLFFGSTVVLPLWLQTQQGYTAYWAGVAVAPIGLLPVVFSGLVGKYMYKVDLRALAALSFLCFSGSFFLQTQLTTSSSLYEIMIIRFIQGTGLCIFFIPLVQISLSNIPAKKYASASGVFNFIRILVGSGFGTSLSVALWNRLEIFHHSRLAESINAYRPATVEYFNYIKSQLPQVSDGLTASVMDLLVQQQAFMLATNDMSWLSAWTFLLITPLPFFCNKVRPKEASSAVAAH